MLLCDFLESCSENIVGVVKIERDTMTIETLREVLSEIFKIQVPIWNLASGDY